MRLSLGVGGPKWPFVLVVPVQSVHPRQYMQIYMYVHTVYSQAELPSTRCRFHTYSSPTSHFLPFQHKHARHGISCKVVAAAAPGRPGPWLPGKRLFCRHVRRNDLRHADSHAKPIASHGPRSTHDHHDHLRHCPPHPSRCRCAIQHQQDTRARLHLRASRSHVRSSDFGVHALAADALANNMNQERRKGGKEERRKGGKRGVSKLGEDRRRLQGRVPRHSLCSVYVCVRSNVYILCICRKELNRPSPSLWEVTNPLSILFISVVCFGSELMIEKTALPRAFFRLIHAVF